MGNNKINLRKKIQMSWIYKMPLQGVNKIKIPLMEIKKLICMNLIKSKINKEKSLFTLKKIFMINKKKNLKKKIKPNNTYFIQSIKKRL